MELNEKQSEEFISLFEKMHINFLYGDTNNDGNKLYKMFEPLFEENNFNDIELKLNYKPKQKIKKAKGKVKEDSKTFCPKCKRRKSCRYVGLCLNCEDIFDKITNFQY